MPGRSRRPFYRARLRHDPTFRAELAYCHDKAVPHSHYLGGPPTWTEADRAKNLAFALEKSERCPGCGIPGWEADADPNAYEPAAEHCVFCQKRAAAQAQLKEGASLAGTTITMIPKAEARRRERARR